MLLGNFKVTWPKSFSQLSITICVFGLDASPLAPPFLNTTTYQVKWTLTLWYSEDDEPAAGKLQRLTIFSFLLISECTLYCGIKDVYLQMRLLHIFLYSQEKDESLAPLFCLYLICLLSHLTGLWKAVRFQLWLAEGDKKETTKKEVGPQ